MGEPLETLARSRMAPWLGGGPSGALPGAPPPSKVARGRAVVGEVFPKRSRGSSARADSMSRSKSDNNPSGGSLSKIDTLPHQSGAHSFLDHQSASLDQSGTGSSGSVQKLENGEAAELQSAQPPPVGGQHHTPRGLSVASIEGERKGEGAPPLRRDVGLPAFEFRDGGSEKGNGGDGAPAGPGETLASPIAETTAKDSALKHSPAGSEIIISPTTSGAMVPLQSNSAAAVPAG